MVDDGIFATTAEVQRKVGANVSSVSNVEAFINQYMTEAESFINTVCGVNYSDTFSTLNVDKRGILKRWAVALAAFDVINYDTSGASQREFERRMDALLDIANKCQAQMKDKIKSDFVSKA